MADHGTFHWNELSTTDVEGAKAFYSEVVGWSYDEMPNMSGGTYWIAKSGDAMAGGLMDMPEAAPAGTPPHWMSYLAIDDVDSAIAKVPGLGGTVLVEAFDIPNIGRMAVIQDPQGAVISLMTPAAQG
ncbi:MAG: VOC family protein [Alphaproteobacteria bacterium]|nr:VOC family protein [Alphaproteobacteria bacterium]